MHVWAERLTVFVIGLNIFSIKFRSLKDLDLSSFMLLFVLAFKDQAMIKRLIINLRISV